jgi:hypothetical protein
MRWPWLLSPSWGKFERHPQSKVPAGSRTEMQVAMKNSPVFATLVCILVLSGLACGDSGVKVPNKSDGSVDGTLVTTGTGGAPPGLGGAGGSLRDGAIGSGGVSGSGGIGAGGTTGIPIRLPDGGLAALLGDSGLAGLLGDAGLGGLVGLLGDGGLGGLVGLLGDAGLGGLIGLLGDAGIAGILGDSSIGGIVGMLGDAGLPSLPDGGLAELLGDGGLLNGILDAPRDGVLGQVLCAPEVKTGVACSDTVSGCVLPSLGGVCLCANGAYVCPTSTSDGPKACPAGAATGVACIAMLTTCMGGGATACFCALGTYVCY